MLITDLSKKVIGLYYDVYNELGFGFLESLYESALAIALADAGLRVERQLALPVWFRHQQIGDYRADLVVERRLLLELKATSNLNQAHEAQLLNYLRATDIEVGILLNFGPQPTFKRMIFTNDRKRGHE